MCNKIITFVVVIVALVGLVILAGVLVLVYSQGSCPSTSTCLKMNDCHEIHKAGDSLKDVMLLSCSDNAGWVCCPVVPTTPVVTSLNLENDKERLLPLEECGVISVSRINGGQSAGPGEYPWMALLEYRINGSSAVKKFLCGGTLINKQYVLTAAHCMYDGYGTPISVRLGELDLSKEKDCDEYDDSYCADDPKNVEVEQVITHNQYNRTSHKNDIALVRLRTNVPLKYTDYIKPICLPFGINITGEEDEKKYLVAGWGNDERGLGNGTNDLRYARITSSPISECDEFYRDLQPVVGPINELQLCAGGLAGEDACKGDSGGPLMDTVSDKSGTARTYQMGIVSFGDSTCGNNIPKVHTRVNAYLQWILNHLKP